MRIAWLLIALLAAPIAAAQTNDQAKPSLTLDPPVLDVEPRAQSSVRVTIGNPLDRAMTFNLTIHPSGDVKARLDKTTVSVEAHSAASVTMTTLVPNATRVVHSVEVVAKEVPLKPIAASATPFSLSAKLELRVGMLPLVDVQVRPRDVTIESGGNTTIVVLVHNGGSEAIGSRLLFETPLGLRAMPRPPAALIGPGTTMEIPVRFEDNGTRGTGAVQVVVAAAGLRQYARTFTVTTVAPHVVVEDPAPQLGEYAIGAVVIGGAAGAWTAAWLTRRHWWPLLLALYTRLRPSKILDHPVRRRIAELVQQNPGVTFSELARLAGVAPGQLTHHARMLEKAGVVFSSPDGQTRRFFHVGAGRLASVAPLSQRALDLVRERPRRASDVAKELGVSRQALHYHVKHLVAEGKLTARVDGREMWLEIIPPSATTPSGASSPRASG